MNIRDLKYIIAVAKEQHFAKAAELSNVSQPALSMQIKKLEDELEVQIFERSQKNFLVTEAGKQIINKAEEVLQKIDDLRKLAKNSRNPFGGELRIGAFPTLAAYYFPKIIAKFRKISAAKIAVGGRKNCGFGRKVESWRTRSGTDCHASSRQRSAR